MDALQSEEWLLYSMPGYGPQNGSMRVRKKRGNQTMKYKILLRYSDEGYSVSVPGLPGCWSQGNTEEEAIQNITDAIHEYLEAIDDLFPDAEIRTIDVAV